MRLRSPTLSSLRRTSVLASRGSRGRLVDGHRGVCVSVRRVRTVRSEVAVRLGPVPARDRDVELGIAPHAVLGDVEARGLDVILDADAPELVHHEERAEGRREREGTHGDETEGLNPYLVERARVDETA